MGVPYAVQSPVLAGLEGDLVKVELPGPGDVELDEGHLHRQRVFSLFRG